MDSPTQHGHLVNGPTNAAWAFAKRCQLHVYCFCEHLNHEQNVSCKSCRAKGAQPKQGTHRTQGKSMPTCSQCRKQKPTTMFRSTRGQKSDICKNWHPGASWRILAASRRSLGCAGCIVCTSWIYFRSQIHQRIWKCIAQVRLDRSGSACQIFWIGRPRGFEAMNQRNIGRCHEENRL